MGRFNFTDARLTVEAGSNTVADYSVLTANLKCVVVETETDIKHKRSSSHRPQEADVAAAAAAAIAMMVNGSKDAHPSNTTAANDNKSEAKDVNVSTNAKSKDNSTKVDDKPKLSKE